MAVCSRSSFHLCVANYFYRSEHERRPAACWESSLIVVSSTVDIADLIDEALDLLKKKKKMMKKKEMESAIRPGRDRTRLHDASADGRFLVRTISSPASTLTPPHRPSHPLSSLVSFVFEILKLAKLSGQHTDQLGLLLNETATKMRVFLSIFHTHTHTHILSHFLTHSCRGFSGSTRTSRGS